MTTTSEANARLVILLVLSIIIGIVSDPIVGVAAFLVGLLIF